MRAVEAVFSQQLAPIASVSAERDLPECAACVAVVSVANGSVAPTTPGGIVVEVAYDTPPTMWAEVGRLNGGVQPHDRLVKRVEIDPLAAHVRVTASGNRGAAVGVAALIASH